MRGAQSVAKAFPEYPTTIVKVYPPAVHLKDYISMAGPEIMTVGKSTSANQTFLVWQLVVSVSYCRCRLQFDVLCVLTLCDLHLVMLNSNWKTSNRL